MFERHRIEEDDTWHVGFYCEKAARGKTEYVAGWFGYREEATCLCGDGSKTRGVTRYRFPDSRRGFERLLGTVKTLHLLLEMEPTGRYWRNLAYSLDGRGWRFGPWPATCHGRLVNPFTLKRDREGQDMSRAKDDYRDAAMVAELLRTGEFKLTQLSYGPWADLQLTFALYSHLVDGPARPRTILRGVVYCLFSSHPHERRGHANIKREGGRIWPPSYGPSRASFWL